MIEKGLNQHNFMPGTERYTRPEEVKALNKFLKSVKDTQEEHTKISEDNLMLPGAHETSGRPRVPKIEDLPKGAVGMKEGETIDSPDSLRQEMVTLEATRDRELETTRRDLEDQRENSLEDSLVDLEDSRETELDESRVSLDAPEDSELSEDQVKLEKGEDQELSEEKITIKGNQDRDLSDLRVTLDGPEDKELDPSLITLEDSRGDLSLIDSPLGIPMGGEGLQTGEIEGLEKVSNGDSQVKLDLQGKGNPDLDKTQLTIDPPKNLDLEKTKHEIDSNEDKELSKTKVTVDAPQTHELDKTKLEIESNQDKPLDTTQVCLDGGKDHELEKTKVTIESNQDKELDKTQIQIETPQDHELERTRHEIESNQDKELETTRLEIDSNQEKDLETTLIQVTRNDPKSLENTQVTIESNQDKELDTTRLEITGNQDKELEETRLEIEGNQDKELDSTQIIIEAPQDRELDRTQLAIESNEDKELETTKLEITGNEDKSLETTRLEIETPQDKELEETKITIESSQDKELEKTQLQIQGNENKDLETFQAKIEGNQDKELEETQIQISSNQDRELDTTQIQGPQENQIDLSTTKIEGQLGEEYGLSETKIELTGPQEKDLDDTKVTLEATRDHDLDTTIISGPVENNPSALDSTLIGGPEENDHELDTTQIQGPEANERELDTTWIEGQLGEDRELDTTRIDISPAPEDVEGLGEEKVGLTVEGSEEGAGNFSDSLDSTLIEGPQENQIDLDNTIIDLSAPEAFEEGQSNSNFKDSLDSTIIEGPETNDRDLDNTQIELKAPEAFEEGSNNSNFSGALDTTIIEGPAENERELDDTQITLEAPEAYVSGESNSNFSDSLEDTIIEGPETNDRPLDDTIIDLTAPEAFEEGQSNSNFSDSLEDTIIEGPEENEKPLDDTQITLDAPDSFTEGADNSNFGDSLEDLILELEDIKNFEEGQDNSNFSEALDETIIEGPAENERELDETQIELSEIKDYEEGQDNSNFNDSLDKTIIKAAGNADLSGRTIFDLDKTISDKEYELSQTELKTDLIEAPENADSSGRTILDLDKTKASKDYALSKTELKTDIQKLSDIDDYEEGADNSNFSEKLDTTQVKRRDDPGKSGRTIFDLDKRKENTDYALSKGEDYFGKETKSTEEGETEVAFIKDNSLKIQPKNVEIEIPEKENVFKTTFKKNEGVEYTPDYKLPEIGWGNFWNGNALNPSTYLRWATANTVGKIPIYGAAKATLIDETLAMLVLGREKLEKLAKANRDRLPGGDLGLLSDLANGSLSVKSAAKSVVSAVGGALSKSAVDRSKPLNRPKNEKSKQDQWEAVGQFIYDYDGAPGEGSGGGGFFKKVGNSLMGGSNNSVSEHEIRKFNQLANSGFKTTSSNGEEGIGIGQTLQDLISKSKNPTNSLDDFKASMRTSRYTTVPEKFTSTANTTNYMTLDSNHIWEIIIKPYVGQLNGRRTWLPSLFEMDKINKKSFNQLTNFSKGWLPVTGFELQDKKLTSKELPLFDGSISFPMGLEFTNELRVTFADDSLKTLKRYFDLCAKVSAYMSNIHIEDESGYFSPVDDPGNESIDNPTVYLEGKVHPGLYKNLSFLITIFILTPQYGTIKKCNLLCVLKDYTIENQGEMDSSPTELSVTFSIVGENPGDGIDFATDNDTYTVEEPTGLRDRTGTSILDNLGSVVDIF